MLDDLVDSKMDYNNLIPVDRYRGDDNRFETRQYLKPAIKPVQSDMRLKKGEKNSYMKKRGRLTEQVYSRHSERIIKKFWHMIKHDSEIPPGDRTKKFSQKVLPEKWKGEDNLPTITVTSLPDDYVHYSQPRILTVREWARLQTFPDWYEFEGNRTTGGNRRSGTPQSTADQIETPKYTQIGNAVPVDLARQIGEHFITLLD